METNTDIYVSFQSPDGDAITIALPTDRYHRYQEEADAKELSLEEYLSQEFSRRPCEDPIETESGWIPEAWLLD